MRVSLRTYAYVFVPLATCTVRAEDVPLKRILFFTKSQRSEHSVIKREGNQPSFAEKILAELAAKNRWEIVTTKDGTVFTSAARAKYDALLFYSTGTFRGRGGDGSPPMTPAGKAA